MKKISVLVVVTALTVLAFSAFLAGRASAATETITPSQIVGAPGTITGGASELSASDNVRLTMAEADTTAISNRQVWLKPNGDQTAFWDNNGNGPGCTGSADWCLVDDDPVHDGNTTYVSSTGLTQQDEFDFEDWSLGSDVTFDFVTAFTVARENQTTDPPYVYTLFSGIDACDSSIPTLTQAFANYSYAPPFCPFTWSVSTVNAIRIRISDSVGDANRVTVTAAGAVVQYDDSDFALTTYLNFTSIPCVGGCDYILHWEGFESLTSETAALQVNADGTWTTIGTLDASADNGADYAVPAEYADTGTVSFRVLGSVSDDETGESAFLDLFTLEITPQPPIGATNPLIVTCSESWPSMEVRCAADELILDKSSITARAWELDGVIVLSGANESLRYATFPSGDSAISPGIYNHVVKYHIWVGGVEIVSRPVLVSLDTTWLWFLYVLIVMIIGIGALTRIRPKKEPEGPPTRKET